jgi:hypothetical protein
MYKKKWKRTINAIGLFGILIKKYFTMFFVNLLI